MEWAKSRLEARVDTVTQAAIGTVMTVLLDVFDLPTGESAVSWAQSRVATIPSISTLQQQDTYK